ncbi:MAG: ABC transporter substrate-binding protein [Firmicutes bacterium]|nr:ABC transporter substrate-binding protein [Bacillota bacterium]MDY5856355.1 ABC transporter substrate-binding protein [Anaerovoracaceae bacterium]
MKKNKVSAVIVVMCLVTAMLVTGCGSTAGSAEKSGGNQNTQDRAENRIAGLTFTESVPLDYAEGFAIDAYEDGYYFLDVYDDAKYLIVPEGRDVPEGLSPDIKVIQQPLTNVYLAATAVMALFDSIDAMDHITMTSIRESAWTIDNAVKAMREGRLKYAGKYSEPDYEMILGNGCDLAIESTMIYHTPEVKEMLEELGITVFVDRSSFEPNPMGRTEWIKVYGVLTGKLDQATEYFEGRKEVIRDLSDFENTGKVAAFFYITTDGKAVVRSSTDYVPAMISMAGGRYAFEGTMDEDGKTSVSMTMESFYEKARDADYIIYNASIDATVKSIDDLIAKDPIFSEFKAVKEGNCYSTGSNMYQRTDVISNMIMDFHKVFTGEDDGNLEFLSKLE